MLTTVELLIHIFYVLLSYAAGGILTGYLLSRWKHGQDIRLLGSGTAGARNAGRLYGQAGFAVTFAGDAAKGALAVGMAQYISPSLAYALLILLAVLAGHLYPPLLSFRGGKGMSAYCGGALLLDSSWWLTMVLAALLVVLLTRSFTLAGLIGVSMLPYLVWRDLGGSLEMLLAALVSALILYAHRDNIAQIWRKRGD